MTARFEISWFNDDIFINLGLHYYNEEEFEFLRIILARGMAGLRNCKYVYIDMTGPMTATEVLYRREKGPNGLTDNGS